MDSITRLVNRVLKFPMFWGIALASLLFVVLTVRKADPSLEWLQQYMGRWDSYVAATLFASAIAFVVIRSLELAGEFNAVRLWEMDESPAPVEERLASFADQPRLLGTTLFRRLSDLTRLRSGNRDSQALLFQVQELSHADQERVNHRYASMRLFIWAIPSCGSLAAILAIAKTVQEIRPGSTQEGLASGTAGLSQSFTVLGVMVGLAIVLVAMKFALEQCEQSLLATVERCASRVIAEDLSNPPATAESQLAEQLQEFSEAIQLLATHVGKISGQARRAGAVDTSSATIPDIESLIQKSISTTLHQRMDAIASPSGSTTSFHGSDGLQEVLQRLVRVLERQDAKLESEGIVSQHISEIIDGERNDDLIALRIRPESRRKEPSVSAKVG